MNNLQTHLTNYNIDFNPSIIEYDPITSDVDSINIYNNSK